MKIVPPYDEPTLLAHVASGDEQAFRMLVDQYSHFIGTHIYRLTHSMEVTEEITQDVFLKIWMTRESLTQVKNFRTYLYVVSRNQALNALDAIIRQGKAYKIYLKAVLAGGRDETDETTDSKLSLLDEAISKLPTQQKKAWLLSRHNRLKYKEIAAEMGISPETVKTYIQLATESITRHIENRIAIVLLGILIENNLS